MSIDQQCRPSSDISYALLVQLHIAEKRHQVLKYLDELHSSGQQLPESELRLLLESIGHSHYLEDLSSSKEEEKEGDEETPFNSEHAGKCQCNFTRKRLCRYRGL